jgi:multicomponent Na+:H+ antiporter subunit E
MTSVKSRISWSTIVSRAGLLSLIWWVLADGDMSSWWIGAPAVLLAVCASVALLPPTSFVWYEGLKFLPFFFLRSLVGGTDVACRVFHPSLPITPDLVVYPLRLPPGLSQVFMANTVSLLPGTLSASLDQSVLKIHVLDSRSSFIKELESVEQRVARMFGTSLKLSDGGN